MAHLLLYCIASAVICAAQGAIENFTFPPKTYFETQGDAYFQRENLAQLTTNQASGSLQSSAGWITYKHPVPLWNKHSISLANFSTHFQFVIEPGVNASLGYGDGLTFFLAPFDLSQPINATGGYLGLFNSSTYKTSPYQIVAVEFDTFQNMWDSDANHVGIDVSSLFSEIEFSLEDESLKNGKQWDAWVDYDGGAKTLQVFLLSNPEVFLLSNPGNDMKKPLSPILSQVIDLSKFLPESVKVGLSASTGFSTETHSVTFWNFTSQHSWLLSASPPISPPNPAPTSLPVQTSLPAPLKNKNKKSSVEIILISVLVPLVAMGVISWWYYWHHRKLETSAGDLDVELDEYVAPAQGPRQFAYDQLAAATGNFSEEQKLGEGGFGEVFKGTLGGSAVAVKRISQGSKQGRKEYISEITIISKLRHRNLVQLLGWCHQRGDLLLVYEFLSNGSLDRYIFEDCKVKLQWKQRYSIACDVASALIYLHEEWDQRVVHRDVKASNVMLDSNFTAKLGDFGLARLLERERAASHTTVVAGTWGYLAPEYAVTGKASPEIDVFSFGAVMLEIACGKRPMDGTLIEYNCRLVEWVWGLHSQGNILGAADERLNGDFDHEEMKRLMGVGLLCSHPDAKARPGMRQVFKILKSEAELPYIPLNYPVAVYTEQTFSSASSMGLNASSSSTGGGSLSSTSYGQNAASPFLYAD